ncbi:hypothetical protein RUND412_008762 [Rhizina undulata]
MTSCQCRILTSNDTIEAVGATPDMLAQAAVASPDQVNSSYTAPRSEAQAGGHAVAKTTMRGNLEPAGREPEAKIESKVGSNGAKPYEK